MGKAVLILISGPAGSGKTTLCDRLLEEFEKVQRVVTATTRIPREGEQDGVDYFFLSKEGFETGIINGEFYEHALVHGRHYGVLKREIDQRLDDGEDLLLNIDVQGAASFREAAKANPLLAERLVTVFIDLTTEQIQERLSGRGTDDHHEIQRRLKSAEMELEESVHFQHRIRSSSKETDYSTLKAIYLKAKQA